jgi:hypothetical protein
MVANHKPVIHIRAVLVRIADEAINARGFTLSERAPETGDKGLIESALQAGLAVTAYSGMAVGRVLWRAPNFE